MSEPTPPAPLAGRRVLIGGSAEFGRLLAAELHARGADTELAPFIRPVRAAARPLRAAAADLADGRFDWLIVTSRATIRVLRSLNAAVPAETRLATVGPATARALRAAGFDADLVPADHSARGLLAEPEFASSARQRILLPQSELASPVLAEGLRDLGHDVTALTAYRIEGVPVPAPLLARVRAGDFAALVVSSGSVAAEVVRQCAPLPDTLRVVAIGPATAESSRDAGLRVHRHAEQRTPASLAEAVEAELGGSTARSPRPSSARPHEGSE